MKLPGWWVIYYSGILISAIAFQTTDVWIVYSTVCSGADQGKHQNFASLKTNYLVHAPLQNNTWFVWIFYYRVWHKEGSIPWGIGATSRGPTLAPGSVSRSFRTRSHAPRSEPKIDTLYDPPSLSSFWGPTIVPVGPYECPTCHLLCERW